MKKLITTFFLVSLTIVLYSSQAKTYVCSFEGCNYSCSYSATLEAHIRTHTGKRCFKCNQCGREFFRGCNLMQHQKSHREVPKKFQCEVCEKTFRRGGSLAKHKQKCTPSRLKNRAFRCDACKERFVTERSLTRHKNKTCQGNIDDQDIPIPPEQDGRFFGLAELENSGTSAEEEGLLLGLPLTGTLDLFASASPSSTDLFGAIFDFSELSVSSTSPDPLLNPVANSDGQT